MTYQTCQNFTRIMNLQVSFYLVKVGFCQLCSMTAGCNSYNQLLFTACCLITAGWNKANRVSSLPILFCPLTVQALTRCPICPRHFESDGNDDYRRHLLHHVDSEEDETACPACPFANMDAKLVLEHFMFTHGNLDKFCCSHFGCDRKFWVHKDYLRHLKNHNIVLRQ